MVVAAGTVGGGFTHHGAYRRVFAAARWSLDELSGSRTAVDWARVVKGLVDSPRYPVAAKIVLVMDQLNPRRVEPVRGVRARKARRVADRHYPPSTARG